MKPLLICAVFAAVMGCASTVKVQVGPTPAVALSASSVAVVADNPRCQPVADALTRELNEIPGIEVDPHAELRLDVFSCDEFHDWIVNQEVNADETRRRAVIKGRAHAVVAVSTDAQVLAHLIGSGRHEKEGNWRTRSVGNTMKMRRAVTRELTHDVASDLASQLNPMPQLAERRVYPLGGFSHARHLHNLAVRAEQSGDLSEAFRLAKAAHTHKPSQRSADYLAELERLSVIQTRTQHSDP